MHFKNFLSFVFAGIVFMVLVLLVFGTLSWLNISTGRFLDWVIALLSFWWLLVIVTVPWNVYFRAKEVLAEAAQSEQRRIAVKAEDVGYVKRLAQRALPIAITLHVVSAGGLYVLAVTGVSRIGYIGSGVALLLTGLRPAIRTYEYIVKRLMTISEAIKYPRQDMVELRERVASLEGRTKSLEIQLDPGKPDSWAAMQQRQFNALQEELTRVRVALENLRVQNQADHDRLARDAQQAIAQLTTDGEFLDHVREILRFFKSA